MLTLARALDSYVGHFGKGESVGLCGGGHGGGNGLGNGFWGHAPSVVA